MIQTRRDKMYSVAATVTARHGVSLTAVLSKSRLPIFVAPRHEIAYNLRELGFNFRCIGRFLGRNHKAVIHACRKHAIKLGKAPNGTRPIDLPGSPQKHRQTQMGLASNGDRHYAPFAAQIACSHSPSQTQGPTK